MRLMPMFIDRYYREIKLEDCGRFQAESCINCGCCTYVCPSFRTLAENITSAKEKIGELKKMETNEKKEEGGDGEKDRAKQT